MSQNKKLRNAIVAILQSGHGVDMKADLTVYPSDESFLVECFLGDEELDYKGLTTAQAEQASETGEIAEYFPTAEEAADCYLALWEWLERALKASAAATTGTNRKKEGPAPVPLPPGLGDLSTEDLDELGPEPTLILLLSPLGAPDRTQLATIEGLVRAYPDVTFGRIDIIENPEVVSRFQVTASPVCLLFKDGQLAKQLVGVQPEKALRAALDGLKS
jgi:hypothetical protein